MSKPILLGEMALVCSNPCTTPSQYLEDQANYVVRVYSRAFANGLLGADWYSLGTGGFNSDLLNADFSARLGYRTLQFLTAKLAGASFAGRLTSGDLEGYRFCQGNTEYRTYWTNSTATMRQQLPTGGTIYNRYGEVINTTTVGFDPVLIKQSLPVSCERRAFWNFTTNKGSEPWPNNGGDLTSVARYINGGPCQGKAPGTCTFHTRTNITLANGDQIESITD